MSRLDSVCNIPALFDKVVRLVRTIPDTQENIVVPSNDAKLCLYGLYKHVVDGPCPDNKESPSILQPVARAKYQAWKTFQSYEKERAMIEYISAVAARKDDLGIKCQRLLVEHRSTESKQCDAIDTTNETMESKENGPLNAHHQTTTPEQTLFSDTVCQPRERISSNAERYHEGYWTALVSKNFGIKPLIPRGTLDISYGDLLYAFFQCFRYRSSSFYHCQTITDEICKLWTDATVDRHIAVGLSVRSLFDVYLCTKNYQPGSEVIVFPPISVPGMMHVAKFHNLNIIPVDIQEKEWWNLQAIEEAIGQRTVAIMIVHPFGTICASEDQMARLRRTANQHGLEIWEDCAECFTGLSDQCYLGSQQADLCFFSFGTIKTATALGGGIATLKNSYLSNQMRRIQQSWTRRQKTKDFIQRIILAATLNYIAQSPLRVGLLSMICSAVGLPFDRLVTYAIRGFRILETTSSASKRNEKACRDVQTHLIQQIRKQPCQALLALMHRRFRQSLTGVPSVSSRVKRCLEMENILKAASPQVLISTMPTTLRTYWAFPINCRNRSDISSRLHSLGFDVVDGASQLCCVAKFSDTHRDGCPNTKRLMSNTLYLPVASYDFSSVQLENMSNAIYDSIHGIQESRSPQRSKATRNPLIMPRMSTIIGFALGWMITHLTFPSLSTGLICIFMTTSGILLVGVIAVFTCLVLLTCFMSSTYWKSSNSFSRHCDLLDDSITDMSIATTLDQSRPKAVLSDIPALKLPDNSSLSTTTTTTAHQKAILTGATGYIGSLLLRDLLMNRNRLGLQGGVIVICRRKNGVSAESRVTQLLNKPMFSFLSDHHKSRLVRVVEGDVTKEAAGLSKDDLHLICTDPTIRHVFHCAAAVSFTQDLPHAANANITSSLNMQSLTSMLMSESAQFVHISTAFVHGGQSGTADSPLAEELFSLGPYDAIEVYKSMLGTQFYATKAMADLRFHNTYTFSKCICEHLLLQQSCANTVIIRPSIVGPAVESPFEGWSGEKPSTIVAGACLHLTSQWNLWYLTGKDVACIPVDVVTRFIIAKAFDDAKVSTVTNSYETSSSDSSYDKLSGITDSLSESDEQGSTSSTGDGRCRHFIYNAVWDVTSPSTSSFTWLEFSTAYLQLGCVLDLFQRSSAYLTLLASAVVVPSLKPSSELYGSLHYYLIRYPVVQLVKACQSWGVSTRIPKILPFIDLPLLFFPFVKDSFFFESEIIAPNSFDGERYHLTCGAAAHRFISGQQKNKASQNSHSSTIRRVQQRLDALAIGGKAHGSSTTDLWWALSQPRGDWIVRGTALLFVKLLRAVCTLVTVDVTSFRNLIPSVDTEGKHEQKPTYLILVPTHRSFFDFILISYLCFALPELKLDIPYIIAADDFEKLPFIGTVARLLRAIYIRRGSKDPDLHWKLATLKQQGLSTPGSSMEVYLEGTRSRDRRFLEPKTGILKCLRSTGGNHLVVPITINYEGIPEQHVLSEEMTEFNRSALSIAGMFKWLQEAFSGNVNIGNIHIVANEPIHMSSDESINIKKFADSIQRKQQENVYVSDYHVMAASKLFGIDTDEMKQCMGEIGCRFWPKTNHHLDPFPSPSLPTDDSSLTAIVFQFSHSMACLFQDSDHKAWSYWLNHCHVETRQQLKPSSDKALKLYTSLRNKFIAADTVVEKALQSLMQRGYCAPQSFHVYQTCLALNQTDALAPFLLASISLRVPEADTSVCIPRVPFSKDPDFKLEDSNERLGFWGFHESGFILKADQQGRKVVTMKGTRYALGGRSMSKLIPFIEKELKIRINLLRPFETSPLVWEGQFESALSMADQSFLTEKFGFLSLSTIDRVRHGTGQSQEDVFSIRSGIPTRIPDAVVWPSTEEHVEQLVSAAKTRRWCLMPFGGGTNVCHATRCPSLDVEQRPIVSVDMKKMSTIRWINEEDGLAHVDAGITGRVLVEELRRRGFTMGHEPDSIEFSTLGGWIATKASGMKRSKYGNIEDIVKSVRVVTGNGIVCSNFPEGCAHGRVSEGTDILSAVFGSEGSLGIITSAIIRIWPLPEVQEYDGVLFGSFEEGLHFVRAVARLGQQIPASVRLLDNAHFRLGQALQSDEQSMSRFFKSLLVPLISMGRTLSPKSVVCATISYEGTTEEVQHQKKIINDLARKYGGIRLGQTVGKSGYEMTFMIAYLRDFAMTYHILGESFETFAPWSKLEQIIAATKKRIVLEHSARLLPGVPFVGCRVTQLYHEGACIYFYLCINFDGVDKASEVFADLEKSAREEILNHGGSLSHHHGIGKLRAPFMESRMIPGSIQKTIMSKTKDGFDADNIFGSRNGPCALI